MIQTAFAKLFETEQYGQILVVRDRDADAKPALKVILFVPTVGALVTITTSFSDDGDADLGFSRADKEWAMKVAKDLLGTARRWPSVAKDPSPS